MKDTRFIFRNVSGISLTSNERLPKRCWSNFFAITAGKLAATAALATILISRTAAVASSTFDLTDLPIEKLMDLEVSILKGHGTLSRSAAAISVLTQEEIRRSGAASIPEALRLVPGLNVARVDASEWAVSARGFNDVFANKLLVLQDGRSIYSPLFSGVFWDAQGTMMEDIDRIEVIRGPGATLWGANAVNGVINILTKSAKDTQGVLLSGGGGTLDRAFGSARYGGKLGDDAYFRVYGMYTDHDNLVLPNGRDANDSWQMARGGFRTEWEASDQDLLTLQGDIYSGDVNLTFGTYDPTNFPTFFRSVPSEMQVDGGNVIGRWNHTFSESADLQFQFYYDRSEREAAIFREKRDTFDFDFQNRFAIGSRNDVIWGLGYRYTSDHIGGTPTVMFVPANDSEQLFSAFVQDEITLVPDRLKFIAGSKFEHNDFTGFEYQPGGRLLWTPHESHTVWTSISRAVRTPARDEEDVIFNQPVATSPFPLVTTVYGGELESETLLAYELGYRVKPCETLSLDLAAFYNEYDNLRSVELGTVPPPGPPPPVFIPTRLGNNLYGETYGFEASLTWQATPRWRLQPTYTFLQMQLHTRRGSADPMLARSELAEGQSPEHQFTLRSSLDLPHNVTFDCFFRYVDELPTVRTPTGVVKIDSYFTVDVRLAWRPTTDLELAIVGQDLLDNRHPEFAPTHTDTQRTEVPRSVYGKITWRF